MAEVRLARTSPINDSTFVSSTVAETVTLYSATTNYLKGTRVRDDVTHKIYESILGLAQAVVTFSGSPTNTVNWVGHPFLVDDTVMFTGGTLPTGLALNTIYYVVAITADTFQIGVTKGGAVRTFTGAGSGTTTATRSPNYGFPVTNTDYWLLISPTNRWAMFDESSETKTTATTSLTVVTTPAQFDTVALLSMDNVSSVLVRAATTGTTHSNNITYSEEFNNPAWTKTNSTVTANQLLSPYNTLTADRIVGNTTNGEHFVAFAIGLGNPYTFSTHLHAGDGAANMRWAVLSTVDTVGGLVRSTYFDLVNGIVGNVDPNHTASIEAVPIRETGGVSGWYRCIITIPSTAHNSVRIGIGQSNGVKSYIGSTSDNIYAWGAQYESASTARAYIPTSGSVVSTTSYVTYEWNFTQLADTSFADSWYTVAGIYTETRYKPDLWIRDIPPYAGTTLTVTPSGTGTIAVGTMALGLSRNIALGAEYGATIGITNYSTIERDAFGNATNVQRAYTRNLECRLMVPKTPGDDETLDGTANKVDSVIQLIAQYRAQPVLWDITDGYTSARIYGYLKDISVVISYPRYSMLLLSVEGLT